jgi:hypothetical protein
MKPHFNLSDELIMIIVKFYTNIEDKIIMSDNYQEIDEKFMRILEKVDNDLRKAASRIPLSRTDNMEQNGV